MKATCINSEGWSDTDTCKNATGPALGDVVHVIGFYVEEKDNLVYFLLDEWPPINERDGYQADCFVFIGDIEFANQQNEEIVETSKI